MKISERDHIQSGDYVRLTTKGIDRNVLCKFISKGPTDGYANVVSYGSQLLEKYDVYESMVINGHILEATHKNISFKCVRIDEY